VVPRLARRRIGLGEPGGLLPRVQQRAKASRLPKKPHETAAATRPFSLHNQPPLIRMLGKSDAQWRKYLFY